jgi:hypothetical protein
MPENTVSVARPGKFGNPWTVKVAVEIGYSPAVAAAVCVDHFDDWLRDDPDSVTRMLQDSDYLRKVVIEGLPSLRGKNLACWCAFDAPCHADVLLELANPPVSV